MNNTNFFSNADKEAIYKIMEKRRDMRHFTNEKVEESLLLKIISTALLGPSVGYMQPWRMIRVKDSKLLDNLHTIIEEEKILTKQAIEEESKRGEEFSYIKIHGIKECSDVILITSSPNSHKHIFGRRTLPYLDIASISCAIQNIWLSATVEGIGMGWVSFFDVNKVRQLFKIPKDINLLGFLCFGHVDKFYDEPLLKTAKWNKPLALDEVLCEDRWSFK